MVPTDWKLWKSDGTTAGTVMVKDMYTGSTSGTPNAGNPQTFCVMNGKLYFYGVDANGAELWVTDGTTGGTYMIKDIFAGGSSGPTRLTAAGTTLYFRATNGTTNGAELWKTDGTSGGTSMVKDIYSGSGSSNPDQLVLIGSDLYFQANDNVSGAELWKSDGTSSGTVLVKDINTAVNTASTPTNIVSNNTIFLFAANNGSNGVELWKSDGTGAGTVLVKNISPETGIPAIANVTALGNKVVFSANDGINGIELWSTDGTVAGTALIKDINTSTAGASSSPAKLTNFGGNIYFFCYQWYHLWFKRLGTMEDRRNNRRYFYSERYQSGYRWFFTH
ncbi:MAG: ELWxxDGT repeat protein [Bacteroidota bacterium]